MPKLDEKGKQKYERESGAPMWVTEICATDADGGEILAVTTAGAKPEVRANEFITPIGLEAVRWSMRDGRSGISFKATELRPVTPGKLKAVA